MLNTIIKIENFEILIMVLYTIVCDLKYFILQMIIIEAVYTRI
jgi:hypothetical protein